MKDPGEGLVVIVLIFFSDDPSLNSGEFYRFTYVVNCFKRWKRTLICTFSKIKLKIILVQGVGPRCRDLRLDESLRRADHRRQQSFLR